MSVHLFVSASLCKGSEFLKLSAFALSIMAIRSFIHIYVYTEVIDVNTTASILLYSFGIIEN